MSNRNEILSISKNTLLENEQKKIEEKEIIHTISLFILHGNFLSFKQTTINL